MNDSEFKGYVKRALEDNDKAHKEIKTDVKEIKDAVTSLKVSSAKGGLLGGAIMSGLAFLVMYIRSKF